MEYPEINLCLEEQQQMLTDATELMKSKLHPDRYPEHIFVLASDNIHSVSRCILKVTVYIAFMLKEGLFQWKDLPSSWTNFIPLAEECVALNGSPLSMLMSSDERSILTSSDQWSEFRCKNPEQQYGISWTDLSDVCRSDVNVVLKGISSGYINRWEDVPGHLQTNSDVAFEAWKSFLRWNGEYYTRLTSIAPTLTRDFFRICIEQEKIDDWDDLPEEYRESIEFARSISFFPSRYIAFSILNSFSDLCEERETWLKVLESKSVSDYTHKLLEKFAPDYILLDRNLMLHACQFHSVLRCVDPSLRHDWSFLHEVLHRYPDQLMHVDVESQIMFPDLILSCLAPFSKEVVLGPAGISSIQHLVEALHSSFWSERRNIETWFLAGLPHPHALGNWFIAGLPHGLDHNNIFSEFWNADEKLMILIASHCDEELRKDSFLCASPSLRNDKGFMQKALEFDPFLLSCASDALQMDFDLALFAIGSSGKVFKVFGTSTLLPEVIIQFLESFFVIVERKLSAHHLFSHLFLTGMAQPQCILSMLGQGYETSLSFKHAIAEYLDVPTGRELRLLRSCANCDDLSRMKSDDNSQSLQWHAQDFSI